MAFNETVKTDALISCGRHCCICHKFSGLKIELHHIKQESEGGDNSFDNCIPLCFDCHSDMRSYDHKHPKGTKYTPKELKGHRDKWYEKVKNNLGTGTTEHLLQDQNTFNNIILLLPPNGIILFLRHSLYLKQPFGKILLRQLSIFETSMFNEPWREFFDSDLESLRMELWKNILSIDVFISENTKIVNENLPNDLIQYEVYKTEITKLSELSKDLLDSYDNFLILSRKKLGVEIE